jgi:hypothetical protein
MEYARYAAKAVAAGVTAGGALLTNAMLDGHIDGGEWVTIVVGTVIAVCAVFGVTNGGRPA